MDERAPLCLAQAHRLEPLIELDPPGSGGTAEKGPKGLGIKFPHEMRKIVSRLTIPPLIRCFCLLVNHRQRARMEQKKESPRAGGNRRCARPAGPGSATSASSSALRFRSRPAPGKTSYRPAVARWC